MVLVKTPQHFNVQANNRQQTRARGTRQNSKRFVALSFYLALDSEASDFGLLFCHAAKNFFHRNIAILEHRIAVLSLSGETEGAAILFLIACHLVSCSWVV